MKPIYARIWSPLAKSFFKMPANEPASCTIYWCEKSDSCDLLKNRQCINMRMLGPKCPHGHIKEEKGPTKRSRGCLEWVRKKSDEHKDIINTLDGPPPDKMAEVGCWIYLPYSHLDMNTSIPIKQHSAFFISGSPYILKEHFSVSVIKSIVDFHPMAMFGGEILDYQKKVIPKFLSHLREIYPVSYKDLISTNPEYVIKYMLDNKEYVGRTAYLTSVNPCVLTIDKHVFKWDGQILTSTSFDPLWISVNDGNNHKAIDKIDVRIIPSNKAVIKITSNSQVSDKTEFID